MSEERTVKMGFERAGELEQVALGDCLWDVHAAGMKALEFTTGRTAAEFAESELLQSVVTTMLGIMTERLEQIRRQFPAEFAKITSAAGVLDVAPDRLWEVVQEPLPEVVEQVRAVLEDWHGA